MNFRLCFICCAAVASAGAPHFPSADEGLDARRLSKIQRLFTPLPQGTLTLVAPEVRARETARALGLNGVCEQELRDRNYGEWIGHALDTLLVHDPEAASRLFDTHAAPPGGESFISVIERVSRWLDHISHNGKVIVITHPSVIRAAILHALGAEACSAMHIDILPLHATELTYNGQRFMLRALNNPLVRTGGPRS